MAELLDGLLGAAGGAAGSTPAARTTTSTSSTNTSGATNTGSSGNSAGNSTYAQNLNPAQTQVLNPIANQLTSILSNPQQYIAPFQTQARNQVNDNYQDVGSSLRQQFLATGGGTSGKYGLATAQANQARLGQLSNVDTSAAQEAASLPLQATGLAENLLGLNFGGSTSSTGTQSTSGTSNSTGSSTTNASETQPGSLLSGLLQGGISGLLGGGGIGGLLTNLLGGGGSLTNTSAGQDFNGVSTGSGGSFNPFGLASLASSLLDFI